MNRLLCASRQVFRTETHKPQVAKLGQVVPLVSRFFAIEPIPVASSVRDFSKFARYPVANEIAG